MKRTSASVYGQRALSALALAAAASRPIALAGYGAEVDDDRALPQAVAKALAAISARTKADELVFNEITPVD